LVSGSQLLLSWDDNKHAVGQDETTQLSTLLI